MLTSAFTDNAGAMGRLLSHAHMIRWLMSALLVLACLLPLLRSRPASAGEPETLDLNVLREFDERLQTLGVYEDNVFLHEKKVGLLLEEAERKLTGRPVSLAIRVRRVEKDKVVTVFDAVWEELRQHQNPETRLGDMPTILLYRSAS